MLNRREVYQQVYAMPGVHFEQHGKLFDNMGWEVDGRGNIIDPDYEPEEIESPKESEPEIQEPKIGCVHCGVLVDHECKSDCPTSLESKDEIAEPEITELEPVIPEEFESNDELELIDRIKIIDKNMDGFLDAAEIKLMLDGYNRTYDHRYRRNGLLKMLKEEMGL